MENKNDLNQPYTFGIWTVKPGKESEFSKLWATFADSTTLSYSAIGKAYLLRDIENPSKFISFGVWDSIDTVLKWRNSEGFKTFVANAMRLCEDFQPLNLKLVYATN